MKQKPTREDLEKRIKLLEGIAAEAKLTQAALTESEEKFSVSFLKSPVPMAITALKDGRYVDVNEAFASVLGVRREEIIGHTTIGTGFITVEQGKLFLNEHRNKGSVKNLELPIRIRGGELRYGLFNSSKITINREECFLTTINDITERKTVERQLSEAEREKAIILDTMSEIVVYIDRDANVLWANRAMYDAFGLTPETFDGTHCYDFHRRNDPCPFCPSIKAMETGEPQVHDDLRSYGKRWVLRGYPVRNEKGEIVGAVEIVTDVTDARNALDALKESEKKYRLLTDRMTDIVWTGNLDLDTTYASPSIKTVLGMTPEERLKLPFDKQVTPDSYVRSMEHFAGEIAVEESGHADPDRSTSIELEYYHKDGSIVWMENIISAIRDEDGRLIGLQGVARDITKRKKIEKDLKNSEREKAIILDTMSEIVVYIDRHANVLWANRAMYDAFGLTPETFDGTHCYDFHRRNDPCPFCPSIKAMETGEPQVHDDLRSYGKRWVLRGYPVRNEKGKIVGAVEIVTDVTDARNALDALKESEEKYRALAENAAMAIVIIQDSLVKYTNPYALRIMGYEAGEISCTPFIDFIYPDDRNQVSETYAKRLQGEDIPASYTARVMTKSGEILWGDFSGVVTQWEGREAVLMFVRDITIQKMAEKKLLEERLRLFSVLDGSPINTFVIDGDRRVILWNLANEFTTGISKDIAMGREIDLGPIFKDRKLPTLAETVLKYSNEEIIQSYSHKGVRKSTIHPEAFECVTSIWIKDVEHVMAIQATRLRDQEGKVIGAIQCAQDITEKTTMEKALAAEHQQLVSILDGSPISTFVIDRDRWVILWNTANEIFTGITKEEALGKPLDLSRLFKDRTMPSLAELVLNMTDSEILARFGRQGVRKSDIHPDALENTTSIWIQGREHILNIQAIRLRDARGEVAGAIQCGQDITEQKKMEEEKLQREKLQSILEMAGAICHELHQPMQIILAQSELLAINVPESDPLYTKLNILQDQIQRMNDITGKLSSIHNYKTRSYVGPTRIIDIHSQSGGSD